MKHLALTDHGNMFEVLKFLMSLFQNPMVFPQAYNKIMGIHEGLGYIDKLKKELDGHRPLSKELAIGLKQLLDVDFTYNSNLSIM